MLTPDQYSPAATYDMLVAASRGYVSIDKRFLHAILDEPAKSLPAIVRFANEEHEDARVDLGDDLVFIARHLRSKELIPFLVECVSRYGDDVPDLLVETVCGFRDAALEPLLELQETIDPGERTEIPFLLASLGVEDERIEQVLGKLAEHDADEASFCHDIYREISQSSPSEDPFVIWDEYPEWELPIFEVLTPEERLEFFSVPDHILRAAAVASFFNEPDLSGAMIQRMLDVTESDPEPVVRGMAWRSLAVEFEDEKISSRMKERLFDPATQPLECAGLVVALAPDSGSAAGRDKVIELFGLPETRAAALEAMWRSIDKAYSPYVKQALDDTDPTTREQAIMGVGYLGLVGELGRVKAMFADPDLRPAALMAYTLAVPSEVSRARMRSLFKKVEELSGGLDPQEVDIVRLALDQRLAEKGLSPLFGPEG